MLDDQNDRVLLGFVVAVLVYLLWKPEVEWHKFAGMGIVFLIFYFSNKLFGGSAIGFDYSPDALEHTDVIKEELIVELEKNSFDQVVLDGAEIIIEKQLNPPVFVFHIRGENMQVKTGIGNALKGAKERLLCPPVEFERRMYERGSKNLQEFIEQVWSSKKKLEKDEIDRLLIQRLKSAEAKAGGGLLE